MVSEESMKQLLSELTKTPKITIALSRWKGINFFFFNLYLSSLSTSKLGKMEMGCDNGNAAFPSTKQSLPEILLNQKSNSTFFFLFFFLNPGILQPLQRFDQSHLTFPSR